MIIKKNVIVVIQLCLTFQMNMLSKRIEGAQKRIEGFNFSARHTVLKFDDVNNKQRALIYKERNRVLDGANVHSEVIDMINEYAKNIVFDHLDDGRSSDEWDLDELNAALNGRVLPEDSNYVTEELVEELEVEEVADLVAQETIRVYEEKCQKVDELQIGSLKFDHLKIERDILLRVVDSLWMDHIDFLEMLRSEIGLRAYGNHDPVIAYKEESSQVFAEMVDKMREETAKFLLTFKIDINIQKKESEQKPQDLVTNMGDGSTKATTSKKLVGRNEVCPCGSGLKYKNCCGKK